MFLEIHNPGLARTQTFSHFNSPCGKTDKGIARTYAESSTYTWDCGCWEIHGLDGYTHESTILEEGSCE